MKLKLNRKYATIAMYALMVIVFGLILSLLCFYIKEVGEIIGFILSKFSSVFFGAFFTICFLPQVRFFERILTRIFCKKKKTTPVAISVIASIIVILIFLTAVVLVVANFIPSLVNAYNAFQVSVRPIIDSIKEKVMGSESAIIIGIYNGLETFIKNLLSPDAGSILNTVTNTLSSIFSKTYEIVLGLILTVYFLVSRRYLTAVGNKFTTAVLPEKFKSATQALIKRIYTFFMEYFSYKLVINFALAVITYIVLRIFHVPYDIIIALIVFVSGFIPVFGPIVATLSCSILIAIFTTAKGHLWQALLVLILLAGLHVLTAMFIEPFVLRKKLRPGPGGVIICAIVSYALFGFWGIPFAVPLYASIDVAYREIVARMLAKKNLPLSNDYYLDATELETDTSTSGNTPDAKEDATDDNLVTLEGDE